MTDTTSAPTPPDDEMNLTVFKGEVDGTYYEVDFLRDSNFGGDGYWTYQVFSGAGNKARHLGHDVQRFHHEGLKDTDYPAMIREALNEDDNDG